ncbi:hypothetical protein, partial [Escherichia albertii]|uniref:hypothetical protein n=3 Tax=Escherichia albertii TaxID=208962 RepID=UPI001F2721AA
EVKRRSADGSVGLPHARVGNCQASNKTEGHPKGWPFCIGAEKRPDATLSRLIRPTKDRVAWGKSVHARFNNEYDFHNFSTFIRSSHLEPILNVFNNHFPAN